MAVLGYCLVAALPLFAREPQLRVTRDTDNKAADDKATKLAAFIKQVEEQRSKRQYDKALETCDAALKRAPDSAQVLFLRGLINSGLMIWNGSATPRTATRRR
jgi:hypothetical protein